MIKFRYLLLLLLAFVGCATIKNARETQELVAKRSDAFVNDHSFTHLDFGKFVLPTMVDYALTNRPSVISARLAVEDARLALKQLNADAPVISKTPWLSPHLNLSAGYNASGSGATYKNFDLNTEGSVASTLSLELLIWDFGRHNAQAAAQAERVLAAELELAQTGYTVFYEVADAYFTLLENLAILEVAHTNEMNYADHLERAKARVDAGDATQLDLLKARLDLANAKETTLFASNDVVNAEVTLIWSLGLGAANVTNIEAVANGVEILSTSSTVFKDTTYDSSYAYRFALTNSPNIRIAQARLRAASKDVDAAIADLMPTASLKTSINFTDPLWIWQWGVSVAQTVFSGFKKTTAVDRSVIALQSSEANLADIINEFSCKVSAAVSERDNAKKAMETSLEALSEARANFEMVREQYEIGEASRVEFSDAVAALTQEMANSVQAHFRGQRAEAALFCLMGMYPTFIRNK